MSTTLDVVMRELRERLSTTEIPEADKASEHDVFTAVPSLEALVANERDRVMCILLTKGPSPKAGVRCADTATVAIMVRWFDEFASQDRMYRDLPVLRERIRTSVKPNILSLKKCDPGDGPLFDRTTLAKATIAVFNTLLEYEVGV